MARVDNFELLKPLLTFDGGDTFYHLKIICRKKDGTSSTKRDSVFKHYYICKAETIDKIKDEVIGLCELLGGRAYLNLAPKSLKKASLLTLKTIVDRVENDDFHKAWAIFSSCAGQCTSQKPRWIVDVDDVCDVGELEPIKEAINALKPIGNKIIAIVPTKSGYHIVTSKFDLKRFGELYPSINVLKNNPTLLYVP